MDSAEWIPESDAAIVPTPVDCRLRHDGDSSKLQPSPAPEHTPFDAPRMNDDIEELFDLAWAAADAERRAIIESANYTPAAKQQVLRMLDHARSNTSPMAENLVDELLSVATETYDTVAEIGNSDGWLQPGQQFGNFRIERLVGQGGMSVVYRATQLRPVKRDVALKLIRPNSTSSQAASRFRQEQQALALLHHPNIATFFDSGEATFQDSVQPQTYCVLEFVEGEHLVEYCQSRSLNWQARLDLVAQVLDALQYAHQNGIVHRDIKPSNILVRARRATLPAKANPVGTVPAGPEEVGIVKLIDFGIAKLAEREDWDLTLTQQGQLLGSPRYMSPEQLCGQEMDLRTDIYSIGLVLYELLAGVPLRTRENDVQIARDGGLKDIRLSQIRQRPDPDEAIPANQESRVAKVDNIAIPRATRRQLEWVLTRCLDPDPQQRYASAEELKTELRLIRDRRGRGMVGPPTVYRLRKFVARHPLLWRAAFVALVSAVAAWGGLKLIENNQLMKKIADDSAQNAAEKAVANGFVLRMIASSDFELSRDSTAQDNLFADATVEGYRLQWQSLDAAGGPRSSEDRAIYLILASIVAADGDVGFADRLLTIAGPDVAPQTETEAIRRKIGVKFEASLRSDIAGLEGNSELPAGQVHAMVSARQAQQALLLARCCVYQSKFAAGLDWAQLALGWFRANDPDSLESLHAASTAVQCYTALGNLKDRRALCRDTFYSFKQNEPALSDAVGYHDFAVVVSALNELHSNYYGSLHNALDQHSYRSFSFESMDQLFAPVPKELVPY